MRLMPPSSNPKERYTSLYASLTLRRGTPPYMPPYCITLGLREVEQKRCQYCEKCVTT